MRTPSLLLLLLLLGCASNPAPPNTLPRPEAVQNTAFGGYILVKPFKGAELRGELLAAGDRVWVRTDRGDRSLPLREIERMRLACYRTGEGVMAVWGAAGTLTTLSHGYILILSAPVWLITTGVSAAVESREALIDFPGQPLSEFARWARYPQGMPVVAPPPPPPDPPLVPKPGP